MFTITNLKKTLGLGLLISCLGVSAQGVIAVPRNPSPAATVSQTIGISSVTVHYSRPSVKGREIWGKLVRYGWNVEGFGAGNKAPWRAGANENTVIQLTHPATVQGHLVPAGDYGLFFTINADNTGEVILSKDSRSWGNFWYDPKQDEMRENITVRDGPPTEMLTYTFEEITHSGALLVLSWEKKQFPVKIEFAVDDIVMANAAEQLKGPVGFQWEGYASAAAYALENKTNLDQASKWADIAVRQHNSFETLNLKAGILKLTGKTEEGEKMIKDAVAISTEAELNAYGYQLLNQQQLDKAVDAFVLNTQRHPQSPNVWDSLGEAYAIKGDKKNAISSFKKSLGLNPPPPVKLNSEKYMRQLGAM